MARPAPDPEMRARAILEAGAAVFARRGFRRAQMSEIAAEMHASPGTLYNAVSSKDALFEAVLMDRFGFAEDLPGLLRKEAGDLPQRITEVSSPTALFPEMHAALSAPFPAAVETVRGLLRRLLEEHYDFMVRNSDGIAILERSAEDFPELASVYFGELRAAVIGRWETVLTRAQSGGHLPVHLEPTIAARSVIELIAWWTLHSRRDAAVPPLEPSLQRENVIDFAFKALI